MNSSELLKYLEELKARGIPLDKVEVLVTVDEDNYIIQPEYIAPSDDMCEDDNCTCKRHELYLAHIIMNS